MKLALLYHQFIPRGGLEGYLREFTARLAADGHRLILVTTQLDPALKPAGAEVRIIPPALTSRGTLARFAARSAALLPELQADAVLGFGRTWSQDIHRAGGGCHAVYSRTLPWWKRWKPKNQWELALERRLYTGGHTRFFVVNSHKVARELLDMWQVPPARIRVIHTAVDHDYWQPSASPEIRQELRRRLGVPDDSPAFLFASLDHRRKGLAHLLHALAGVPAARLWVAGQSLDSSQGLIRRLGLGARVTGLGRADLLPWFQAVDWFVHPTQYDACANTVLQSMACGLPGMISAADGAVEFVREAENGTILHQPGDAGAILTKLQWAAGLPPDRRAALGAAARRTVLPLTWAAHLQGWQQLISKIPPRS